MTAADPEGAGRVERAFGAQNRARLLQQYFTEAAGEPVTPTSAWRHVYRLLLWIDRTIGLAHCYESDKCQPGRPWYARSLRFHRWVAAELGSAPDRLARDIDWLFGTATLALAEAAGERRGVLSERAAEQRAPYAADNMPFPGEDPELEELIRTTLTPRLGDPPVELLRELAERIQAYFGTENKRKNLVGEGFEDTVAEVLRRIPTIAAQYDILVRPALHELPGFYPPRGGEKTRKVDLALVRRADEARTLVSCKWSVRSDREEQFATDFNAYSGLEQRGADFDYVLVTNEFDPARLAAACDNRRPNGYLFTSVVHVNPEGPLAAYGTPPKGGVRGATGGIARAAAHIQSGRLASLDAWLTDLSG